LPNISEVQTKVVARPSIRGTVPSPPRSWSASFWQIVRFGIVGTLNTTIDVLTLNILLWHFPTHDANLLLLYNSIAYTLGALNSFGLNKYWTFKRRQAINGGELVRFAIVNIAGFLCNDSIIWITARILHPLIASNLLWANASKLTALSGTMIVSYLGMRLWVFASKSQERRHSDTDQIPAEVQEKRVLTRYSLSVILPAHNEEAVIADTIHTVIDTLTAWVQDFEVIVVNDGSKDATRTIVEAIAATDPRVRLINYATNQGYGAALVSGFEAVTKDLVFFMDSDGQFDIRDLERFFPFIGEYDAVLGYRINRQDTWMRKLNAWGWKMLVSTVFGLHVRDVDCAFKLYRADFFREHRLETRGAMINAEILYKFTRAGYTYTQVGVHHLPRRGGRATGAKPAVIARAFRELFTYAWKWHAEERKAKHVERGGNT
jgi:putative flippase GtrA